MNTTELSTSLERLIFHIVEINTPFLLCLVDLDRLEVYFNNLINELVQKHLIIITLQIDMRNFSSIILLQTDMKITNHSIIRRYEHAFLLWKILNQYQSLIVEFLNENLCYLIEIELRRLHRRFGHSSARRLHQILERTRHDVDHCFIEHLIKFCHHCQMHEKSSGRFIFSIRDENIQFNFNILVNILYIECRSENKPVLHLMNEFIRFQANRWLKDISAKHVWDQLRACWIDIYLRSSDVITADADKQFVAREFKQYADNMRITIKTIFVETHHSIEMMKRYHDSLRRVYAIITTEISSIDLEIALQMTFKVINDSIELDDLILTLLVFDVYSRMIEMNASSSTIIQRAIAMKKIMKEVKKFNAIRQMNDALNTRNGFIFLIHDLSLNSSMLIFREDKNITQSRSWQESFKLLSIQNESAIIELSNDSIKFRSTSVKSYHQDQNSSSSDVDLNDISSSLESSSSEHTNLERTNPDLADSIVLIESIKRGRGRSKKYSASIANVIFNIISIDSSFTAFRQKEIIDLLEKEIFLSVNKRNVSANIRIFNSRFVDEVKNPDTEKAFEKFRLMIQAFNDQNKIFVLIQSSIIQRINQRLIICLVVSLSQMKLYLRNITQVYVQFRFNLNRDFYVQSSPELIRLMRIFNDCILKMIKSLYDVSKADNHWFKTYHDHHTDKLNMTQFTYDSCLLYIINHICMRIVSMQTDDTLILADQSFAVVEEEAIHSVKLMIKTRDQLISNNSLKFNDTRIERFDPNESIYYRQETHIQDIQLIQSTGSIITNARDKMRIKLTPREQYVAQRAREAYLTSICQFEASFDLSHAAQSTDSTFCSDDVIALNKRLQWQIINQIRGLQYVKLNQSSLQLVIFNDSFFANNRDLFSQIDYVICLADATHANILHWFSIKCKRITRSVLTIELFAMIHDFDVDSVLKATLTKMLDIFISLILVIDSKSLYDCLVRLEITVEKRLMMNVMILRQSYERREITEIKWIHESNNSVDSMTKSKSFSALKTIIDINRINLDTIEWVKRAKKTINQIKKTEIDE